MLRFLINPHSRSGKGKAVWKRLQAALPQGLEYQAFETCAPGQGISLAAALTEKKEDPAAVLAVVGGDGTINEALNGAHLENQPILCCLPTGSGNDFVRGRKLPSQPLAALKALLGASVPHPLDYGSLHFSAGQAEGSRRFSAGHQEGSRRFSAGQADGSRRFLVSCGIGYDAAVCACINRSRIKGFFNAIHLGKLAYLVIGIGQILRCRRVNGTLSIDGGSPRELKGLAFLSCHNLPYEGGGLRFAPDACPEDGQLDLCVVTARSRLRFAAILISAFLGGRHTRLSGVSLLRCRKASLRLEQPLPLHTDGEFLGTYASLEITCHPLGVQTLP